ncbi:helix-turn-helix domain-containing protein [Elusimicrobiota bacterium]
MSIECILIKESGGGYCVRSGELQAKHEKVCTVEEASKMLKRSARHIYRMIREGVLNPRAKFLDKWLLSKAEVKRMACLPKSLRRPPKTSRVLFPEYFMDKLNPYRDQRLIFSRILDGGGRGEAGWLIRRYPLNMIRKFLAADGPRAMSPKSLRFWSLYFGLKPPKTPKHVALGRKWGGIATRP